MSLKKIKRIGEDYYYHLNQILGRGSDGIVFKGKAVKTKQRIAVKMVQRANKSATNQQTYIDKALFREVKIFSLLQSPNIIKFIDIVETKNHVYIIQELANQGTLAELIVKNQRLSEQITINYLTQIVNGMGQLVKNGFIHRDLKPQNILIKDDILKISDFGHSRKSPANLKMISYVGTLVYMAPEIITKDQYSSKCDIWALGVIAYEMITGIIPWKNKNRKQIYEEIIRFTSEGVQFPPHLKISSTLKGFIRGCLLFQEYDRFDWVKIFWHPLFGGQFINSVLQNQDFKPEFALTRLRISVHEQNINILALFKDLPDQIDIDKFVFLLQTLQKSISSSEAKAIFKNIQNQGSIAKKQSILNYFEKKKGIDTKGLTIEQLNKKYGIKGNQHIKKNIENLCKIIETKKIDMFDLFFHKQNLDKKEENFLSQEDFNKILKDLDPSLNSQTLEELFIDFDQNNDGKISYTELYCKFCRINRVIMIKNHVMAESLRKFLKPDKKKQVKPISVSAV